MTSHSRSLSRNTRLMGIAVAVCVTPMTLACSALLDDLFSTNQESCGTVKVPVSGQWTVTGTGSRSGCNDRERDGDISLMNSRDWTVSEGPGGTTLIIDTGSSSSRIEESSLNNACVTFRTREVIPGDSPGSTVIVTFDWEGVKEASSNILLGTFTGDSTDGCSYDGRFEVVID